ncbi:MAG: hypothetical protein K0S41_3080 [Anaerocolumna sp.]|jgi:fermentation-respiration switch protein FrsA (DUF1100 family)|nr:hypothetical protein [Anaerocolumna sp.]
MEVYFIKKKSIKILITISLLLIILICTGGFLLAFIPSHMSEKHTNKIVNLYFDDVGYSRSEFISTWEAKMNNFELISNSDYVIPVTYICPKENLNNKTMILVHWHESNHEAMYPLAEVFLEKGWNVVLYDQRAHGKNSAKTVTFGYLESLDLQVVIEDVYKKSNDAVVGALGQSMGAATIAFYSGTEHANKYLDFAIIDSAYSSMDSEINWEIESVKLPLISDVFTSLGSTFCKLLYGYDFYDVNIKNQIQHNEIPTLIMHSKKDNKCPYYMGEELFNTIPHSKKEFITFRNSEHLFAFWDEKERYVDSVFSFIDKYVK